MKPEYLDRLMLGVGGIRALQTPPEGWLKTVRESIGFTQSDMAKYFKVTRQAVADYEHNERTRQLSLAVLHSYTNALGCDLVYCLVPRAAPNFTLLAQTVAEAFAELSPVKPSPATQAKPTQDDLETNVLKTFFQATEDPTQAPDADQLTRQAKSFSKNKSKDNPS